MIVLLVLENDSRELDSIQVSSTDVAIRILRPYIVQILYKYGVVSEFLFLRNGICIEFEKEVVTPLNSIITVINGVNSMVIRAIKQAQHVYPALYSDYSQFSFPYNKNGYLSLQPMNVQPVPLMQQAADVPQSSVHPAAVLGASAATVVATVVDTVVDTAAAAGKRAWVGVLREREPAPAALARGEGERTH